MSYARILGGSAVVSGGLYAYYRFRDSGQQVCKLRKLNLTCAHINFVLGKLQNTGPLIYISLNQKCLLCYTSFFKRF